MDTKENRVRRPIIEQKESCPTPVDLERPSNAGDFDLAWHHLGKGIAT
jgi:hypothetical protein